MPGLVPGIHVLRRSDRKAWMAGPSPAMTAWIVHRKSRLTAPSMIQHISSAQAAILAVNSIALGGLLFLLSAGFSLIFGLMRIPNLVHGSFFMLGAYFGVSFLNWGVNFWIAALLSGLAMA